MSKRRSIDGFHSDVIKSLGLLSFYVYYVEDDLEINIFRSYQFHNVFRFENTAF